MILETIASYIESKGVGKIGKDIFCHYMPSKVKSGYLLAMTDTGIAIDPELKGYYQDVFPFMIRGESISVVNRMSTSFMSCIDVVNLETKDVFFHYIRPLSLPAIFPQNDGGSFESGVAIEFSCIIKNK